jgi:site-specific DNA-adenine methylase
MSATAKFASYHTSAFGRAEHERLARACEAAAKRGARVVVSNYDLPWVRDELYPGQHGWKHTSVEVRHGMSRGRHVRELLAVIGAERSPACASPSAEAP